MKSTPMAYRKRPRWQPLSERVHRSPRARVLLWCTASAAAASVAFSSGCGDDALQTRQGRLKGPERLDFGTVYVGREAVEKLAVQAALGPVELRGVQAEPQRLQVLWNGKAIALASDATASLDVVWSPSTPGELNGVLTLRSDNSQTPDLHVTAVGEAVAAPGCDDDNPCTQDSWSAQLESCVHRPSAGECDDGNPCTELDQCQQGRCVGVYNPEAGGSCSPPACDDGNPCTDDTWDDAAGACVWTPNAAACDDGDQCTVTDNCQNGSCSGRFEPSAAPQCQAELCDPSASQSEAPFISRWFEEVWSASENDVWAVGKGGHAIHWDGSTWRVVSTCTDKTLFSVWGFAADDVWAVGAQGTALRWDGERWRSVDTGTTRTFRAVWGASANDVWLVGDDGMAARKDASGWSSFATGTEERLWSVWGSGPNDVWAVGENGSIVHFDGTEWRPVDSPAEGENLFSVRGLDAETAWVVGVGGLILEWNGDFWERQASETAQTLFSVWGSSAESFWVTGTQGTIRHFDRGYWIDRSRDDAGLAYGMYGTGAEAIWIATNEGEMFRWNGSTLQSVSN